MKAASNKLYDALFKFANQAEMSVTCAGLDGNWADSVRIHLSAWVDHVDSRAVYAQSTQRRSVDGCTTADSSVSGLCSFDTIGAGRLAGFSHLPCPGYDDGIPLRDSPVVGLPRSGGPRALRQPSSSVSFGRYRRLLQRAPTLRLRLCC